MRASIWLQSLLETGTATTVTLSLATTRIWPTACCAHSTWVSWRDIGPFKQPSYWRANSAPWCLSSFRSVPISSFISWSGKSPSGCAWYPWPSSEVFAPTRIKERRCWAKPCARDAAANESLKLLLHEQGGAALVVLLVELPEKGPQMLADHALEYPLLRRATHVRSGNFFARSRSVKLHGDRTRSRLVPLSAPVFSACFRSIAPKRSGGRRRNIGSRQRSHLCGLARRKASARISRRR